MPSNYTQNYSLNQWEADDQVCRADFNADNAKIDAAIAALAGGKADKTALAGLARVEVGSYVGSGTCGEANPNTLTFSFPPKVVGIVKNRGGSPIAGTLFVRGQTSSSGIGSTDSSAAAYEFTVGWSGNNVTWYSTIKTAERQLNVLNISYVYFAIG